MEYDSLQYLETIIISGRLKLLADCGRPEHNIRNAPFGFPATSCDSPLSIMRRRSGVIGSLIGTPVG
jgi:hypothetical protein